MGKFIIIVLGIQITTSFFETQARGFVAVDSEGYPIFFDSSDEAIQYQITNYSLNTSIIAFIPTIQGSSTEGYYTEEI